MRVRKVVMAMVLALSLIFAAAASADSVNTDFENFTLGSVNTQDGWKSAMPGDVPALPDGYDQAVVAPGALPSAFGLKALRASNAVTNGEFHFQTYSKPVTEPAGENVTNKVFTAEFSFLSATPDKYQPGLALSVSPSEGEGARMAYVRLEDTPSGIRVFVDDTPNHYAAQFDERWLATLDRSVPHTIKFEMKFVPGEANDIVRIAIDGVAKDCGTSWENYYRYSERDLTKGPDYVLPIDRLHFRASVTAVPALAGKGFLFDNVSVTTAESSNIKACPLPVGPPGPAGATGAAGTPGAAGATTTAMSGESAVAPKLIGNTKRTIHAPLRQGERFISARATLRNKRLPVHGRHITVDLRGKVVGNYNVFIVAKYKTKSGTIHVHRSHRSLSVTRALSEARTPR